MLSAVQRGPGGDGTSVPLVVHIIHRLAIGGLENGLVNLINHMPPERYRHAIVCMTESTDFRNRIRRSGVEVIELHKKPGHDFGLYVRLWRNLRRLRPAVVHTRNIGTLECQAIAWLAGVGARVHGEHGRDMADIDGKNARYIRLRRAFRPLVSRYIAVSRDLADWLQDDIGVSAGALAQIYNGVDTGRFGGAEPPPSVLPAGFVPPQGVVFGTVGRLSGEKDQPTLLRAFVAARALAPQLALRLVLVGDGPMRAELEQRVRESGVANEVWVAGARSDIPEVLRSLDFFVLPSLGEGISNTILEAMACGLPVIATRVGGNPELVREGESGSLVPAADPEAMAREIVRYAGNPALRAAFGAAAQGRIEREFSMRSMVEHYARVYDAARQH